MIVYLQVESGPVRVFITKSPRLALLRAVRWSVEPVKLIGTRTSKRELALLRRLHRKYKRYRIARDWFTADVAADLQPRTIGDGGEQLLDVRAAARKLGVSVVTLRRYVQIGFPHVRVGRQLRFVEADLI